MVPSETLQTFVVSPSHPSSVLPLKMGVGSAKALSAALTVKEKMRRRFFMGVLGVRVWRILLNPS